MGVVFPAEYGGAGLGYLEFALILEELARVDASVALIVGSFAKYGFSGHALLGAVFCPALTLLAVIDLEHKLLPNAIILPACLAVGLIVAVSAPPVRAVG